MDRNSPVRKLHTNTSDLLVWPENSSAADSSASAPRSSTRPHQPSDRISKVLFGGQVTEEEAQTLMARKPCSGHKMKEMTGSAIFADGENGSNQASNKTGLRVYQQVVSGISQISFSAEESVSPKKPISLPEVAKQRELSGNLKSESDAKKKQLSDAKCKELSGNDIFGPPPEILPRPLATRTYDSKDMGEPAPRNVRTSVKVSNPAGGQSNILFNDEETPVKSSKKIHNQKFQELSGNNIFKGDTAPGSTEKPLSSAKLREMNGSDIFSDGTAASRDFLGGVRKPPGGESSISLV